MDLNQQAQEILKIAEKHGAEVYCLANSREQARIIYDECRAEVEAYGKREVS